MGKLSYYLKLRRDMVRLKTQRAANPHSATMYREMAVAVGKGKAEHLPARRAKVEGCKRALEAAQLGLTRAELALREAEFVFDSADWEIEEDAKPSGDWKWLEEPDTDPTK